MLQNAYSLAKFGFDTAENEQHFAEILPIGGLEALRAERLERVVADGDPRGGRAEQAQRGRAGGAPVPVKDVDFDDYYLQKEAAWIQQWTSFSNVSRNQSVGMSVPWGRQVATVTGAPRTAQPRAKRRGERAPRAVTISSCIRPVGGGGVVFRMFASEVVFLILS